MAELLDNSFDDFFEVEIEPEFGSLEGGGSLIDVNTCTKKKLDKDYHDRYIYVGNLAPRHVKELVPHLSEDEQREAVSIIRLLAHSVVRLHVLQTSSERPEKRNGMKYPGKGGTYGSGWIDGVYDKKGRCNCKECLTPGADRKQKYARIDVYTVRHVVFNNDEAKLCSVCFWDESIDGKAKLQFENNAEVQDEKLFGGSILGNDTDEDFCKVRFFTHDTQLIERLKQVQRSEWSTSMQRLDAIVNQGQDMNKLMAIGHPHGKAKVVSFGNYVDKLKGCDDAGVVYDANSCPGMSGCLILPLCKTVEEIGSSDLRLWCYIHSGGQRYIKGEKRRGESCDWAIWM